MREPQPTRVNRMFVLPDELAGYRKDLPVFYYVHHNTRETNNSKLRFTTHCLSIGVNGIKKLSTVEGVETFAEGHLLFFSPGNYLSYQNVDNDLPYQSLMIFFSPALFPEWMKQICGAFQSDPALEVRKPYLSFPSDPYLAGYLQSVLHLQSGSGFFTEALQKVKLFELVFYLDTLSGHCFRAALNTAYWPSASQQLHALLENQLDTDLTLEELAFLCHMSLASFKRYFTRCFGVSPGKWFKEKRLARAALQIREFNRSPKEVYHQAGYVDYSSFSHAFKQLFGVSPKEYGTVR